MLAKIKELVFGKLPSQASLDAMLEGVTRVRLLGWGEVSENRRGFDHLLLEVQDPESIGTLRDCLAIVEDPKSFFHCMCLGDFRLEFYQAENLKAALGLHHGRSIRWGEAWERDAWLRNPERLLRWFAARGVLPPLERFQEEQRQHQQYLQAAVRWREAMPPCLSPFWSQMFDSSADWMLRPATLSEGAPLPFLPRKPLPQRMVPWLQALQTAYPDPEIVILELLRWYGSGQGPWSGFPAYEEVPELLLMQFPASAIVAALGSYPPTAQHLEGAARLFASYEFWTQRREEWQDIPVELKERLLEHSLRSAQANGTALDQDKVRRAKSAFAR